MPAERRTGTQSTPSTCIFTILSAEELGSIFRSGKSGEFQERRAWTGAKKSLEENRERGADLAVVFACAHDTDELSHHACIDRITIVKNDDGKTSRVSIRDLTPFDAPRPRKSDLVIESSGKNISANDSRPYRICRRPSFLDVRSETKAKASPQGPRQSQHRRLIVIVSRTARAQQA